MKKLMSVFFLAAILLQSSPARADCNDSFGCFDTCECFEDFYLGFKYAAFFPLSGRVSKIYNGALPDVEVELATSITASWQAFFNAGYIWNYGYSSLGNKTDLSLVPLTFGLKYLYKYSCNLDFYLGAGAAYSFLRIHDHSKYVHQHVNKNAWGATVKSGVYYHIDENFYLEGFFDYFYQPFHFGHSSSDPYVERFDLHLDGLKLGVGAGVTF